MMGCTRIAPTPSGYLHEGNAANFMLVAFLAKAGGLRIQLRIDDLDRSRFRMVYLQDIFDVLQWMGIDWDDGPRDSAGFMRDYSQLLRLDVYDQMLSELRIRGAVYACRCTRSTGGSGKSFCLADCPALGLSLDDPDLVWICRVDPDFEAGMHDYSGNLQKFSLSELGVGDFVVRRRRESVSARCFPSYQLASVADDVLYGTSLIVRGADLFHSSLRQLWLSHCLDLASFASIRFVHHELLMDAGQQKLSKSAGNRGGEWGRC
jgi:glutamyl-tRNA synthetase